MSLNLDRDGARFSQAARHRLALRLGLLGAFSLAALLVLAAMLSHWLGLQPLWASVFLLDAAALVTYAGGLLAAVPVTRWRSRQAGSAVLPFPRWLSLPTGILVRAWKGGAQAEEEAEAGRPPALVGPFLARVAAHTATCTVALILSETLALILLGKGWAGLLPAAAHPPGEGALIVATLLVIPAFGYLVAERRYAACPPSEWPEAESLGRLARLPVLALSATLAILLLAFAGFGQASLLLPVVSLIVGLAAAELLLRSLLRLFQPAPADDEPGFDGRSGMAGLLDWPPRPVLHLQKELSDNFGIDLRQVWAFAFIRNALPKIAVLMTLVAWLCSGLGIVPVDQRGIYERFGRPVAVLQPGLHVGLPWPLSRIVPVENGAVHELATTSTAETRPAELADAEDAAPETANRLWDGTHVSEKSQVIANRSGNAQAVEIVNMDVRFLYRIGLDDASAMNATYHVADLDSLTANIANRALMHDFAARTLDDVLVSGREGMSGALQHIVQADLDRLNSGIELLSVVVEAIHPPAGAAAAYHSVQAAQITAQGLIAREHSAGLKQVSEAKMGATVRLDDATATARGTQAAAVITQSRFNAEQDAYRKAGQAFVTETYFRNLVASLGRGELLILDHRIGDKVPILDFRNAGPLKAPDDTALNEFQGKAENAGD